MNPISNPHAVVNVAQARLPHRDLRIPGLTIPDPGAVGSLLISLGAISALLGIGLALLARFGAQPGRDHAPSTELEKRTLQTRRRLLLIGRYCCYSAAATLLILAAAQLTVATLLLWD